MQITKQNDVLELYEWLEISGTQEEIDNAIIALRNVEGADLKRQHDTTLIVGALKPHNPGKVWRKVRRALR